MTDFLDRPLSRRSLVRRAAVVTALGGTSLPAAAEAATRRPHRILIFTRTTGFRHASIEIGVQTIRDLGAAHGFEVEHTEDPAALRARHLRRFTAVAFLNTTGNILTPRTRRALRRFVTSGGGWVGIHSAADTEYNWPFYGRLLARGRFLCHPLEQPGVIVREDPRHQSTAHLPRHWRIPVEEFYSFTHNPRPQSRVLLSIDEDSYQPDPNTSHLPTESDPMPEGVSGVMGDHPMSWTHRVGDGIAWYTALGHEVTMYALPEFRDHLLGGLLNATRHGRRNLAT